MRGIARARSESLPSRKVWADIDQIVAFDGNSIAAGLHKVFGVDLIGAKSVRAAYGVSSCVAEAVVYPRRPERVARRRAARCSSCS
jgi:hypothetical protein